MAYREPQWTNITILISQIVQAFNLECNQDLLREFGRPYRYVFSVVNKEKSEFFNHITKLLESYI